MSTPLPAPGRTRWQPLRAGLIDLFYYDAEEFWFRDGRLLLRGNNGTGKSKVLALTLPFLLDGELSAHRVEPDADPKKRMEWNLLLGGEHPHPERLGYTWIEFGRLDEDSQPRFTTLGCGLKAAAGRGITRHWFFVTDRRVGPPPEEGGLRLVDSTGVALSSDRLEEALGERGTVYKAARAYRRAVDEKLFRLGEQRYGALVDLLVQLRQPQLSKRPSEKALSKALTESLPPVDQAVVADVAEAFRSLDEEKEQLAAMAAAEQAADTFLKHYRRYARIAARRKARAPRLTHSRYEALRTELGGAETDLSAAHEDLTAAEAALTEIAQRRTALRARDEALRAGPEMRSARELERAAEEERRTAREAERAEADRTGAAADSERAAGRLAAARGAAESAAGRWAAAGGRAGVAARAAGLATAHEEGVTAPLVAGHPPQDAERTAHTAIDRRTRAVDLVEHHLATVQKAQRDLDRCRSRQQDADTELTRRADLLAEAESESADAQQDYLTGARSYFSGCTVLRPGDPARVLEELTHWTATLNGPDPARAAARAAAAETGTELARRRSALESAQREHRERERELSAEHAELAAGGQRGPRVPYTRAADGRTDRPGAPLWRLVDTTGAPVELTPDQRGGLEAALESSGLLDAWVSPGGDLILSDDTQLTIGPPVPRPALAQVLTPAVNRSDPAADAVPDATVGALLAGIGLLDPGDPLPAHGSWVSTDGRFRLGALAGSWSKPTAEYLGEGAREAARRARMAAIDTELTALAAHLSELSERTAALAAEERTLAAEAADLPDDADLRRAHAAVAACQSELSRASARRTEAERGADEARHTAEEAAAQLHDVAAELHLSPTADGLRAAGRALAEYREALAALWPAVRETRTARTALAGEETEHERASTRLADLTERHREATATALTAGERHRTLAATVGAAVAELQSQLASVAEELRYCDRRERAVREEQQSAIARQAAAGALLTRITTEIEQVTAERAAAVETLRRFTATGLLTVALPELDHPAPGETWAPDPSVRLARRIDQELQDTDDGDGPWERVQRRITEELKDLADALARHGHSATARMMEDGLLVDVIFQGREQSVPALATALTTEVADRKLLLSAREQEILENHLITEVAGTLQELVSTAEHHVLAMNGELADRPTSTGMRLRLVWRPARDAPSGLAAARERLLRQSSDAWTHSDRAALGAFLQAQIDRARTENPVGTWLEHLTTALDYRTWHEFGIERHQHGRWQSATGPASGGERVLAVSLPLFAAASSHYASAGHPHAPRLVTLDEAFAGVDDDSRAKSLGLLGAFDLDVVMTSEREWGCYPQVPGLAIAQLSRVDEVAAVLVTRWEWDGHRRTRADAGLPDQREETLLS
ncbi:TIGR02680 family protein [Streptomyces xiamenensis]